MRLTGIDYGEKRVGIASTDEGGQFALPRVVLQNDEALLDEVERLCRDWQTERIIVGESRDFKGEPNKIHRGASAFAQLLRGRGFEVEFHPELLTSMEAERLQGKNEMLDASAAALILKSYLDTHKQ
jgi:putative holliday junction resolvase